MNRLIRVAALAVAASFAIAPAGIAAKAPAKKPAAKAPAKKPVAKPTSTVPHVVQGTTQLKGEYAEFGKAYTLGKEYPMNITLKSAEYTCAPLVMGESIYYPNADEKMLVIHYIMHNPQSAEEFVRWDTFGITAIDGANTNREYIKDVGIELMKATDKGKTPVSLALNMKPAQKIDVFSAIMVPASGEVPKLMFKSSDNLVLRYDLKGKVKPLPAMFADPGDATGYSAPSTIKAQMGTNYPVGGFAVTLDKAEFTSENLGEYELEEGERFLLLYLTVKNLQPDEEFLYWDSFVCDLVDVDGTTIGGPKDMFANSRNVSYRAEVKPAQEAKVRYLYTVPADQEVKTFSIGFEESHKFMFDVSGAQ